MLLHLHSPGALLKPLMSGTANLSVKFGQQPDTAECRCHHLLHINMHPSCPPCQMWLRCRAGQMHHQFA